MKSKILTPMFLFSLAGTALAYNLLQPLPGVGQTVETFPDYIAKIIPFILGLAAVLAVVEIVIGGIEYAVTEAIDAKADAKDRITQAIIGLLLALTSWLILNTINPKLLDFQLNIPGLPSVPLNLNTPGGVGAQVGGGSGPAPDVIAPPPAKIESVCLSSVGIILSPTTNACDSADCASRGGSCIKAISLPPISSIEKKAIVVPGNFSADIEQRIQTAIDSVYDKLPSDYKTLKNPVLVVNRETINEIYGEVSGPGVDLNVNGFAGSNFPLIKTTMINGDTIIATISGDVFNKALIHELAHARAQEKFNKASGNEEWQQLYDLSNKENRGFATVTIANSGKPYASTNAGEDLAESTTAYVSTNGQYKTGDKRSDAILAQKFTWLEKNGFVKKMR